MKNNESDKVNTIIYEKKTQQNKQQNLYHYHFLQ